MTLVDEGAIGSEWDKVMLHLARWLMRHLDIRSSCCGWPATAARFAAILGRGLTCV